MKFVEKVDSQLQFNTLTAGACVEQTESNCYRLEKAFGETCESHVKDLCQYCTGVTLYKGELFPLCSL